MAMAEEADVKWIPLELWRASSLAQETQAVTYKYGRILKSGDAEALRTLRASIEARVDDLENFYVLHVDDERGVLFEKQRLKLRKLLHTSGDGGAGSGHRAGVSEDARLGLTDLMAWFLRDGRSQLKHLSEDDVSDFFASVAPASADGKVTVRELRLWYFSPAGPGGAGAGAEGAAEAEALAASAGAGSAGSPAASPAGAGSSGKAALALRGGAVGSGSRGRPKPEPRLATTRALEDKKKKERSRRKAAAAAASKPVYAWETAGSADLGASGGSGGDGGADEPPVGLQGMLEFQVRLTPEEYTQLTLARRSKQAMDKHMARATATLGVGRSSPIRGGFGSVAGDKAATGDKSLLNSSPYVEPSALAKQIMRSSDRDTWITDRGFDTNVAPPPAAPTTPAKAY